MIQQCDLRNSDSPFGTFEHLLLIVQWKITKKDFLSKIQKTRTCIRQNN